MFMGHLTCLSGHSLQFMGHSSHVYRDTVHMFMGHLKCLSAHSLQFMGHSSHVYRDTVHMFMGHLTCLSGHSLQFMGHISHVYRDTVLMFIRTQFTCLSGHGSHVHGTPHMFIGTQFTCVWDTSHVYPASRLKMVLMFKALFHGNRYADAEIPKYVSYQAEISLRLQPLEIRGGEARQ